MADKLTWDEIKKRFPDEWVVLLEYGTEGCDLTEGIIGAHGKDREQVHDQLRKLPSPSAILFTGEVRGGLFGFHEEDLERQDKP